MAAGKPIVATDVDAMQELLDEGRAGVIVSPENAETLAEAIRNLLADDTKRNILAAAAHHRAFTRHNPQTIFPHLAHLIAGSNLENSVRPDK